MDAISSALTASSRMPAAGNARCLDEALKEARRLAQKHKEICSWPGYIPAVGKDRDTSLCDLIRGMCEIEPLERIRISSIEITEITDELLTLMETQPKIARHLHIPLPGRLRRDAETDGPAVYDGAVYGAGRRNPQPD